MKKLLREQMKKIKGGLDTEVLPGGDGCAAKDSSCYYSGGSADKTCCAGLTCKDQGNETGSLCK